MVLVISVNNTIHINGVSVCLVLISRKIISVNKVEHMFLIWAEILVVQSLYMKIVILLIFPK